MICLYLVLTTVFINGCATVTRSTLLGIGTGAAVGAVGGSILSQQDKSQAALNSALVMAVIGGVAGYFTHKAVEDRDAHVRQETLFNLEKFGVSGFGGDSSFDSDAGSRQKVLVITDDPNWTKENKKEKK